MNRIIAAIIFTVALFVSSPCFAENLLLSEDFTTNSKVDMEKTDAVIEPDDRNEGKPVLKLPRQSASQALDFVGDGLVVADKSGLRWMSPETGKMVQTMSYTDKSDGDIIGVLAIKNTQSVYAWSNDKVIRLDYDGTGISKNPVFSVMGMEKVVSVSLLEGESEQPMVAVLGNKGGNMVREIWAFDGSVYFKVDEQTVPGNPLALTGGNNFSYFVHYANNAQQYELSSGWNVNPGYNLSYDKKPLSVKGQKSDVVSMDKDSITWYNWTGNEHLVSTSLSQNISDGVTMAVHYNDKRYAYINESGQISYYQYDGSQMVENPALRVSGVELDRRYFHPKMYYSKPLVTSDGKKHNVARLVVDKIDTNPYGVDKVTWEISTDGGTSWQPITATNANEPAAWTKVKPSSSVWLLRATLDTTDDIDTPRIKGISLYSTYMDVYNIQIQNVSGVPAPYPIAPPGIVKAGSEVAFTVHTKGVIGRAEAVMKDSMGALIDTVPLTMISSKTDQEDDNEWAGRFVMPVDYTARYTGDVTITVIAYNDHINGEELSVPVTYNAQLFLTFGGNLFDTVRIKLTQ